MPAARVKGGPCPFRQSPFRRKALTVFDISRSHQRAWMSGFGGTRSPFARDIKQSNVPGSQDLGRSAPLRKTGAPCGIRTHAAARRGGLARARTAWRCLDVTFMARIGRVGSLSRESMSPTRVAVVHAHLQRSAIPMVLSRSGRFGRPLRAKSPASARTVGARVYCFNSTKDREKSPIPLVGSVRTVTTPSIRFPLSEATKCVLPVLMIVAPVLEFCPVAFTSDVGSKRSVAGSGVSVVVERFANGLKCARRGKETRHMNEAPLRRCASAWR